MDRAAIAHLASKVQTKEELLSLLNRIKMAELQEVGLQDSFRPFTMKQLNFYCNPNNVFHRYRQFNIKKKSGGVRQITSPRSKNFMMLLQAVNDILKSIYIPSDYAMGFIKGRSVVNNAGIHVRQNYVLNIDLKDFFPSIEQWRVWKRLQLPPFKFPQQIASLVAGFCCMRKKRETLDDSKGHDNDKRFQSVLPQGAPTSPIITNMICDNLDRRLAGLARHYGLHYSRYADDITFSSMHYVYSKNGEFWKELNRIITEQGFCINSKKTRLQKQGGRQEVTGITVNEKPNVTQKYVRDIRNLLYIWDRHGYSAALSKFLPKYKSDKGHVKKGNPDLINVIVGKLLYLKMVKGEEDSVYVRLHEKFQMLSNKLHDVNKTTLQDVTYIETTPILEFEKINNTEIVITSSQPYIDIERDNDNPAKLNETPVHSHRYAWFMFAGSKVYATINKSIKEEDIQKENLSISLCRNAKDKQFWLIHKQDKVTVRHPRPVNIDELLNDLDSLINIQDG